LSYVKQMTVIKS